VGAWQWKLALTSRWWGDVADGFGWKMPRLVIVWLHWAVGVPGAHCATSYSTGDPSPHVFRYLIREAIRCHQVALRCHQRGRALIAGAISKAGP